MAALRTIGRGGRPGAADPGPPDPQSNAQAWENDESRRNCHAAAPSTHPCGGTATAATAAPRPPEPEANRMVLSQKKKPCTSKQVLSSALTRTLRTYSWRQRWHGNFI